MQRYLSEVLPGASESTLVALLESSRHAGLLASLAARAIGTTAEPFAVALADRRCRIGPPPLTLDYLLRAELLHRSGDVAGALRDLDKALDIEPEHLIANRKRLVWGEGRQRIDAALCLAGIDPSAAHLKLILATLAADGVIAAGRASVIDGRLNGWATWSGDRSQKVAITIGDRHAEITLRPDPAHPLAVAMGSARSFDVAIGASHGRWRGVSRSDGPLALAPDFSILASILAIGPQPGDVGTTTRGQPPRTITADVTVIVPVFRDLDATRACLDSLLAAVHGERIKIRIVVVDDASPEPQLSDYVRTLPVDRIVHARNLGFVHAVNSALATVSGGDILLLNADTVVPTGFVGRLRAVAHSSTDIGTVTPLTNNGELTSQPTPFRDNPLPTRDEIATIDRAAAAVAHPPIDLPSGIGFCLYVTRACLDIVGQLSHRYERGYYEDVHLCLAAAAAGLRNVGAANVYVGHAGTRSFGLEKRRLVVRNAARLKAVFPDHDGEVAAFVAADPLRPVRHAIGRQTMQGHQGPVVIAARTGRAQAESRARELAAGGADPLQMVLDRQALVVCRFDRDGKLAAETEFALAAEREAWHRWRADLACRGIEVFCPRTFIRLGFETAPAQITMHVADATELSGRGSAPSAATIEAWQGMAKRASLIVAPCAAARDFALAHWPQRAGAIVDAFAAPADISPPVSQLPPRLGVLLLAETGRCRQLLRRLGRRLPRASAAPPAVVVLGETGDDLGLMRHGGLFVTGPCTADELPVTMERQRITHLMLLSPGASFGAPIAIAAAASGLPLAAFAWTSAPPTTPRRLWFDPAADDEAIATALADWLASGNGAA